MKKILLLSLILIGIIGLIAVFRLFTFYKLTYHESKQEIMNYGLKRGGLLLGKEKPPKVEYCLIFDLMKGYSPGKKDKSRVSEPCCPLYTGCK